MDELFYNILFYFFTIFLHNILMPDVMMIIANSEAQVRF